jgi:hypothetical protein
MGTIALEATGIGIRRGQADKSLPITYREGTRRAEGPAAFRNFASTLRGEAKGNSAINGALKKSDAPKSKVSEVPTRIRALLSYQDLTQGSNVFHEMEDILQDTLDHLVR